MRITLSTIEQAVIIHFDITKEQFQSSSRIKIISEAKRMFCYQAVVNHDFTNQSVANYLGKDHSSVMYHIKTANDLGESDKQFIYDMRVVDKLLQNHINRPIKTSQANLIKLNAILEQLTKMTNHIEKLVTEFEPINEK